MTAAMGTYPFSEGWWLIGRNDNSTV